MLCTLSCSFRVWFSSIACFWLDFFEFAPYFQPTYFEMAVKVNNSMILTQHLSRQFMAEFVEASGDHRRA